MKIHDLQNKKILIAGYGAEGKATEQFLKEKVPSAVISITDQKDGADYLSRQSEYDLVIKTPGIHKSSINVPYTTATNIFFAQVPKNQIIGVTGSKGKSTTASLIHHILKTAGKDSRLVGNIGKPALEELSQPYDNHTIFVYELSSYQLEDIEYSPHIAVITSLFPEHMNYHGSLEDYYLAKKKIINFATAEDYYIYNPTFPMLQQWKNDTKAQTPAYISYDFPDNLPLIGQHNVDNMRAAAAVAKLYDLSNETIDNALLTFKPLPHRLEKVATFNQITFYDDAISTTPESTIAALDALENVTTIFLGGENRGYDFSELVKKLKTNNVKNILLFPESGKEIKRELSLISDYHPHVKEAQNMEEAVAFAYEHTLPGSICLLSTASPSYTLWKNFEEKGEQFQMYVKQMGSKK